MPALPMLPPEARLLLAACRTVTPESDEVLRELVTSRLDWRLIGQLAERENLAPVLWTRLRDHATSAPGWVADRIHAQAAITEFRMALTESTLRDVVERLAEAGIEVMLLKGAALATTVYPSFAARPMGDLDLLVRPAQAQDAWERLVAAGWRVEFPERAEFYRGHHHLAGLLDPRGLNLILEIHRAMLPPTGPFRLDEDEVWRAAGHVRLGQRELLVPSAEHQLLHLCIHFAWAHMMLSGLGRTVRDVATLTAAETIRWDAFVALAHATKAGSCADWTLGLARELAAARVPLQAIQQLRPRPLRPAGPLRRAVAATALLGACPSISLMRRLWSAAIRPAASGHGDARPWKVTESFQGVTGNTHAPGVWTRVQAQSRRREAWWRFVRLIVPARPLA